MLFEVIVVIILVILLVNQFDLWNRFRSWFNQQSKTESSGNGLNYKGLIFIALVGALFALIVAFFQTNREINFASTSLALEQLSINGEVIAESAVNAQTEAFKNAFDFTFIYWNRFFENTFLFIVLPILIGLGTVFMHDEMKKAKEELANVTIGRQEETVVSLEDEEEVIYPTEITETPVGEKEVVEEAAEETEENNY